MRVIMSGWVVRVIEFCSLAYVDVSCMDVKRGELPLRPAHASGDSDIELVQMSPPNDLVYGAAPISAPSALYSYYPSIV